MNKYINPLKIICDSFCSHDKSENPAINPVEAWIVGIALCIYEIYIYMYIEIWKPIKI